MASAFLDLYEPLDIIGNGSFGIIRKVRRKSDGLIFARKELNFERMSERDRKQIVAEVNILKDLHHDHIVRYHDRFVDRDNGILYILMEYCGGGDLSSIIKTAHKQGRQIPEETVWNYFMQILLALQHCHHPNTGRTEQEPAGYEKRPQILHRDLKPDNVFLSEDNKVKLGDFGLSKALGQASFANTYVGTPYYMSPELMQEKAYDSKSDIWSLGCVIYELCALRPPFYEAKTHSELSICIRNGRIPPLPKGYSTSLSTIIKAMLNLNPAMRPSATQLLQHERIELVYRIADTERMLASVKLHKANVVHREKEVAARETALREKEALLATVVSQKDTEIATLQQTVVQLQSQQQHLSEERVQAAIRHAVVRREEELREAVTKREKEVGDAIARREEEIMDAVRRREAEVDQAWAQREAELMSQMEEREKAVEEKASWLQEREEELYAEEERLDGVRKELESLKDGLKGRKEKAPFEEVKNILEPLNKDTPLARRKFEAPTPKALSQGHHIPMVTPAARPSRQDFVPMSAMKGVVLTTTGESLATPKPSELVKIFDASPKVGLNFAKIFDFESGDEDEVEGATKTTVTTATSLSEGREELDRSPPPSPSSRKVKTRPRSRTKEGGYASDTGSSTSGSSTTTTSGSTSSKKGVAPPTRIRRPSLVSGSQRDRAMQRSATLPASESKGLAQALSTGSAGAGPPSVSTSASTSRLVQGKPLPHPHLNRATSSSAVFPASAPEYDLADVENLPSPFLKRAGVGERPSQKGSVKGPPSSNGILKSAVKRPNSANGLRTLAAVNSAAAGHRRTGSATPDATEVRPRRAVVKV